MLFNDVIQILENYVSHTVHPSHTVRTTESLRSSWLAAANEKHSFHRPRLPRCGACAPADMHLPGCRRCIVSRRPPLAPRETIIQASGSPPLRRPEEVHHVTGRPCDRCSGAPGAPQRRRPVNPHPRRGCRCRPASCSACRADGRVTWRWCCSGSAWLLVGEACSNFALGRCMGTAGWVWVEWWSEHSAGILATPGGRLLR